MARIRHPSKFPRSRAILGASRPYAPITPEQASENTSADAAAADFVAGIDRVLGDMRQKAQVAAAESDSREHGTREALEFADLVESLLPQGGTPEGLEQPNILEIVRARRIAARVSRAASVPAALATGERTAAEQFRPVPPIQLASFDAAALQPRRSSLRVLAAAAVLLLTLGSSVLLWQRTRDLGPSSTEPASAVASTAIPPASGAEVVPEARRSTAAEESARDARAESPVAARPSQPISVAAPTPSTPLTSVADANPSRTSEMLVALPSADARSESAAEVSPVARETAAEPEVASNFRPEPAPAAAAPSAPAAPALPASVAADERDTADDERLTDAARERAVRRVVSAYERAYDSRSVSAVAEIWPSLDTAGFSRAFDGVREQDLSFDQCVYTVEDARAIARCPGRVRYVGRVGRTNPQVREAVWTITMARVNDDWRVADLNVR